MLCWDPRNHFLRCSPHHQHHQPIWETRSPYQETMMVNNPLLVPKKVALERLGAPQCLMLFHNFCRIYLFVGGGVPKKKLGLVSTTQLKNHESKNGSFPPHFKRQKNIWKKKHKKSSASWRFFKISASASCGGTFF